MSALRCVLGSVSRAHMPYSRLSVSRISTYWAPLAGKVVGHHFLWCSALMALALAAVGAYYGMLNSGVFSLSGYASQSAGAAGDSRAFSARRSPS